VCSHNTHLQFEHCETKGVWLMDEQDTSTNWRKINIWLCQLIKSSEIWESAKEVQSKLWSDMFFDDIVLQDNDDIQLRLHNRAMLLCWMRNTARRIEFRCWYNIERICHNNVTFLLYSRDKLITNGRWIE